MEDAKKIKKLVDTRIEEVVQSGHRGHLGASLIGKPCARQAWYTFRWATQPKFDGRMLRLFDRGHSEEHRFCRFLRNAGYEIRDYSERLMYHSGSDSYVTIPWEDVDGRVWAECDDVSESEHHILRATSFGQGPKQWSFIDHNGHFAGSSDGKIKGPHLPPGWGGLEFKTSAEKPFNRMVAKGVALAKPEHNVQMQIYMHYMELSWTLYVVVNKNNDDLYFEIVEYRPEVALRFIAKAGQIIEARKAPPRISNDPTFFTCKHYCDHYGSCHLKKQVDRHCRSCQFVIAAENKSWYCDHHKQTIPDDFVKVGCSMWAAIE